jgi:hypothetical protein
MRGHALAYPTIRPLVKSPAADTLMSITPRAETLTVRAVEPAMTANEETVVLSQGFPHGVVLAFSTVIIVGNPWRQRRTIS